MFCSRLILIPSCQNLSTPIKALRHGSSKDDPQNKQNLWREYFWSRSFCLLTTGGAPIEVIKRYIESQGEKL
jgi:putative transposase